MKQDELIPQLFKTEYRKLISVLCKLFGTNHIEIGEDIANDTFLLATETWGLTGIPENPTAWLYTVAKNKARDYFKRHKIFSEKIVTDLKNNETAFEDLDIDLSGQNISDNQLQMIFAICHPVLSVEAQIGLALRILCGFGIDEIAEAFLTSKETINKRLFRAREKLRKEKIKIELPEEKEMVNRLSNVITTIYLLFNEGYYSKTQSKVLRKELCLEAMRLNFLLLENPSTNKPIVNALMALMCFHSSRFNARINETGESILYNEQDRTLWDDELIAKGNQFLIESAQGEEISKYHLEASIAYWHCTKLESANKWENILQLYNQLLQIDYSPIAALNRTYALSQTAGKLVAIAEAEKLILKDNHLYFSLLGNLYTDINNKKAIENFEMALELAVTEADQTIINKNLNNLKLK